MKVSLFVKELLQITNTVEVWSNKINSELEKQNTRIKDIIVYFKLTRNTHTACRPWLEVGAPRQQVTMGPLFICPSPFRYTTCIQ